MHKNLKLAVLLAFVGTFTGCVSSTKMPINSTVSQIDTSEKSILLGRVIIENQNKPSQQPKLARAIIEKDGKMQVFTKAPLIAENKKQSNEFVFSLASEPGEAELSSFHFVKHDVLFRGEGYLPFDQKIVFPENQIVYIGNIHASIVPRKDGQPRAGAIIPLIDQAVTGFSTGTYTVNISDNYEEDIALLKSKFPYLANKEIGKMILPSWSYPEKAPKDKAEK